MGIKSRTFDVGGSSSGSARGAKEFATRLTEEERKTLEARIRGAKSLDEVARLEKELREGMIVTSSTSADRMEE